MTEGYRPDGPTANKVRGLIPQVSAPFIGTLCLALARDIDDLREYVARLEQQLDNHEDQEQHWDGS